MKMRRSETPVWADQAHEVPELVGVLRWDRLGHGLESEVWRVTRASGGTLIVKGATGFGVREAAVYTCLLEPLGVRRPILHRTARIGDTQILLIEDVGDEVVGHRPTVSRFVEAARLLANMRRTATQYLDDNVLPPPVQEAYTVTADDYAASVDRILDEAPLNPSERMVVTRIRDRLPRYLDRLYRGRGITLTHNDFNAKNLIVTDDGVVAIDWAHAELTPHLGNLYCLVWDASRHGVPEHAVMAAYAEYYPVPDVSWQTSVGGLCWLVRGLQRGLAPASAGWTGASSSRLKEAIVRAMEACLGLLEAW